MAERWSWGCCDVPAERSTRARQLDAIGWGAFFIWVGIALLADVGIGTGLLGVGIIVLGGQALRWLQALPLEGFWVVVGTLFLLGGIWELFSVQVGLVPVLLIAAGVLLFVAALRPGRGKQIEAGHRG
jgi:hypothetical protein